MKVLSPPPARTSMSSLAAALPTAEPSHSKNAHAQHNTAIPPCFADVERLKSSKLLAHQKAIAALEGIHSAVSRTGTSSPAAYLTVILISLQRLNATTTTSATKPQISFNATGAEDQQLVVEGVKMSRKMLKKSRKNRLEETSTLINRKPLFENEDVQDTSDGSTTDLMGVLIYLMGLALRGCTKAVIRAQANFLLDTLLTSYSQFVKECAVTRQLSQALSGILAVLGPTCWKKARPAKAYRCLVAMAISSKDSKTRRKSRMALGALSESAGSPLVSACTSKSTVELLIANLSQKSRRESADPTGLTGENGEGRYFQVFLTTLTLVQSLRSADSARLGLEIVQFLRDSQTNSSTVPHRVRLLAVETLSSLISPSTTVSNHEECEFMELQDKSDPDEVIKCEIESEKLLELLSAIGAVLEEMRLKVELNSSTGNSQLIVAFCMTYAHCTTVWCARRGNSMREIVPVVELLIKWVDLGSDVRREIVPGMAKALNTVLERTTLYATSGVVGKLQLLLDLKYANAWGKFLWVLKRFLEKGNSLNNSESGVPLLVKEGAHKEMKSLLLTALDVRKKSLEAGDHKSCRFMESVSAAALRGGAAEILLEVVNFGQCLEMSSSKYVGSKSEDVLYEWTQEDWLLPIIRDHTRGSKLEVYLRILLPLVEKANGMAEFRVHEGRVVAGRIWRNVADLVRSCFAAFCKDPQDLGNARMLKEAFDCARLWIDDADVEKASCGIAIVRCLAVSIAKLDEKHPSTRSKRVLFANGFRLVYPSMFEHAKRLDHSKRERLLDCLTKAAGATCDSSLVAECLKHAVSQLLKASAGMDLGQDSTTMKHVSADVALSLAESGIVNRASSELNYLQRAMIPLFNERKDAILQKKAYRTMALLISADTISFENEALRKFVGAISDSQIRSNVNTSSKAARLGLIQSIIETEKNPAITSGVLKLCTDVFLPEIIIHTRESSERTREAAFNALIAFARAYNVADNDYEGVRRFLTLVAASFAAKTPSMISATLSSLGRIIYDFKEEAAASSDLATTVDSFFVHTGNEMDSDSTQASAKPGIVGIMLRHRSHEVQRAALGLVKLATSALRASRLRAILPGVIPGLVSVAASSKKHETRLRVRVVLERLLRKCGRERLEAVFPKEHVRLLASVRKQYSRDLAKKHESRKRNREEVEKEPRASAHVENDSRKDNDNGDSDELMDSSDSDLEACPVDGKSAGNAMTLRPGIGALNMREPPGQVLNLLERSGLAGSKRVLVNDQEGNSRGLHDRQHLNNDFKIAEDGRPIFIDSDVDSDVEVECGSEENGNNPRSQNRSVLDGGAVKRKRNDRAGQNAVKKLKGSFGEEFQSMKADGDVKKAGRPDPYAYVPLGSGMSGISGLALSKRKDKGKRGHKRPTKVVGGRAKRRGNGKQ